MEGLFLYTGSIIVVVLIMIIVIIHFVRKIKVKKVRNKAKDLEIDRNVVASTPVLLELSKVEPIIKNDKMEEKYTFEMMWEDLNNGYQIYYTYVRNRYLLFKTAPNCYTQKLLSDHKKNPQPKMSMLTLKRVKEMFPDMEDIEYKIISDT